MFVGLDRGAWTWLECTGERNQVSIGTVGQALRLTEGVFKRSALLIMPVSLKVRLIPMSEAQSTWEKHGGESSAFIPGTKMHKYIQRKDVIY
jgi:hypothetical protein